VISAIFLAYLAYVADVKLFVSLRVTNISGLWRLPSPRPCAAA